MPKVSGQYNLPPGYLATSGTTIQSSQHNTPLEDIAQTLTGDLPRDGSAAMTGNFNMGSQRITNLAAGTQPSDAARVDQLASADGNLSSLSGLTLAADRGLYSTAADTLALFTLTAAGRALLDDADASAQRTTLGLGSAAVADLTDNDDLSVSPNDVPTRGNVAAYVDANPSGEEDLGVFYNSAVDGTVTGVITPDFEDGYKYRIQINQLAGDAANFIYLDGYMETTAAYTGIVGATASGNSVNANIEMPDLRYDLRNHIISSSYIGGAGTLASGNAAIVARYFSSTIEEKILRFRITRGASNITGGTMRLFREPVTP